MKIDGPYVMRRRPNNWRQIPAYRQKRLGDVPSSAQNIMNDVTGAAQSGVNFAAGMFNNAANFTSNEISDAASGNFQDTLINDPLNFFGTTTTNAGGFIGQQASAIPQDVQDSANADVALVGAGVNTVATALGINWVYLAIGAAAVAYLLLMED